MTALLASLALAVSVAQAQPGPTGHEPDVTSGAHEAGGHAAPSEPTHGAAAAEHGAAGEHGTAEGGHGGEHGGSLSDVLLHHVSDGYAIEYPCFKGGISNCEIDLKHAFGDSLVFQVGGTTVDMTPTKHVIMMWLASALLLLAFVVALRNRRVVPRGLYNFLELLVQFVRDEIAVKNIGAKDADRFVPYLCTAFFFILFINLFGLIPWSATATGNVAVTLSLAAFTFVITQYAAIRAQGIGGYLKHLTGGVSWMLWPIMIPVEILGLFTKPFALTIRLFANMVAGHIVILSLLGLIFALGSPFVAIGSVPMALAIFLLEIFVAFVQAYIFTMLSSLFIGAGLVHHDEGHGEHAHESPVAHGGPGMGDASHGSHVAGKVPSHG